MTFKNEIVKYVLSNIRNRMEHEDYENTIDAKGNSIVKILKQNFYLSYNMKQKII